MTFNSSSGCGSRGSCGSVSKTISSRVGSNGRSITRVSWLCQQLFLEVVVLEVMVGMTSAEITTDAGHCSTLHIMNMAISSHCHVPMLGFAERFHKPSITQHTVDINIIIFLCYTLPKQQLPRMDRCTATSNSGKQHPAIQTSTSHRSQHTSTNSIYQTDMYCSKQVT